MPRQSRHRRQSSVGLRQLRLLIAWPAQEVYELLRPIVLFGQPPAARAQETGVPERNLRRSAIVALKAEHPPFGPREIARICRRRFGHPVGHHTVTRVLATEPVPTDPPRRFRRYHAVPDPVQRRIAAATALAEDFLLMLRQREGELLPTWLDRAEASGIADLARFARKLRTDLTAVQAGLTLRQSNGQTEGQINRLKLIKRQGHGQAKVDLLRKGVLARS